MPQSTYTVFTIYDVKSESYGKPVFSRNRATVERELRDLLAQGQTQYALHPEDYTIFEIGTWSEFEPFITYHAAPDPLGTLMRYAPKPGSDLASAA